jgi:predicted nucleic acid-binding protein
VACCSRVRLPTVVEQESYLSYDNICAQRMRKFRDSTPYRSAVARLRERFEIDRLLISPAEADWREAWNCYVRREGNSAGILDCISFVVMRRLGIQEVFTNDEHFRAAGFETLF